MLGHMVCQVLRQSDAIEVHGTRPDDRQDAFYFNVEDGIETLATICDRYSADYEYFINCIGMLGARIDPEQPLSVRKAILLNALFPHQLSALARHRGIRVIHISTDGVFQGDKECYDESAPHDCRDLYGITKSLGEVTDKGSLTFRCSIVGPSPYEKGGLLEWFLGRPEGSTVSGFTNQIWHGASTTQFAKLCLEIVQMDRFETLRAESPVFHFAPNEPISKYQLLCLFRETLGKRVEIRATVTDGRSFRRVLTTRFRGLREIYPHGLSAEDMVKELAEYLKSN